MRVGPSRRVGVHAGLLALLWVTSAALAQDGPPGLTAPVVLPPFNPLAASCTVPPDLQKSLGLAKDNDRQFIAGVGAGLKQAAADRGLGYDEGQRRQ